MTPVFLEDFGRPLLVGHALAAFALLGAAVHLAVAGVLAWRGRPLRPSAVRTWGLTAAWGFGLAFGLGLLMYPHFRVHVRGEVLDATAPWASNLFDMKEAFAALALPLVVGVVAASRSSERSATARAAFAAQAVALAGLVALACVAGLVVTATKGV